MAEKHHHHHRLFHHHKDEEKPVDTVDVVYSETTFDVAGAEVDYKMEEKRHKHLEHLGEIGAASAGAYALVSYTILFQDISTKKSVILLYES